MERVQIIDEKICRDTPILIGCKKKNVESFMNEKSPHFF